MKYRELERISEQALTEAVARAPIDLFVIWTGVDAQGADESFRLRALRCITEVDEPVPLRVLMRRAARIAGEEGMHPDHVRSAVRSHQRARPACYLLCRRVGSGAYVAVTDIPFPALRSRSLRTGDTVVEARVAPLRAVGGGLRLATSF